MKVYQFNGIELNNRINIIMQYSERKLDVPCQETLSFALFWQLSASFVRRIFQLCQL